MPETVAAMMTTAMPMRMANTVGDGMANHPCRAMMVASMGIGCPGQRDDAGRRRYQY
ncbi:MAG: hypothetical protein ACR2PA_19480 [Hyphomicrobiaceae bacterium]